MPDVGKKFENLLNTGNLVSKSGLDLSQATGFTVVAEKLNFFRWEWQDRSRACMLVIMLVLSVRRMIDLPHTCVGTCHTFGQYTEEPTLLSFGRQL